jgi:hypothetical protein
MSAYGEPTLDEIVAEPIVRLLMARDGVDEETVRRIAAEARNMPPVAPDLAGTRFAGAEGIPTIGTCCAEAHQAQEGAALGFSSGTVAGRAAAEDAGMSVPLHH